MSRVEEGYQESNGDEKPWSGGREGPLRVALRLDRQRGNHSGSPLGPRWGETCEVEDPGEGPRVRAEATGETEKAGEAAQPSLFPGSCGSCPGRQPLCAWRTHLPVPSNAAHGPCVGSMLGAGLKERWPAGDILPRPRPSWWPEELGMKGDPSRQHLIPAPGDEFPRLWLGSGVGRQRVGRAQAGGGGAAAEEPATVQCCQAWAGAEMEAHVPYGQTIQL